MKVPLDNISRDFQQYLMDNPIPGNEHCSFKVTTVYYDSYGKVSVDLTVKVDDTKGPGSFKSPFDRNSLWEYMRIMYGANLTDIRRVNDYEALFVYDLERGEASG